MWVRCRDVTGKAGCSHFPGFSLPHGPTGKLAMTGWYVLFEKQWKDNDPKGCNWC